MQSLSVASHLVWLSAALGGVMGALFLAPAIHTQGPGVLWGYLAALLLFTQPAYQAEEAAFRLAGRPWVVAAADGMRMRHMRPIWLWVTGAALMLLLLLCSLMLAAAALSLSTDTAASKAAADPTLGHMALVLFLVWCLASTPVPRLGLIQLLGIALALWLGSILIIGLMTLALQPMPWLEQPLNIPAVFCGMQYGMLSSLLGLGIYYAIRVQPYLPWSDVTQSGWSWPWALVIGQALWTLALVGWSQHWWETLNEQQGLSWLLHSWTHWAQGWSWLGIGTIALVLILGARLLFLPWRQWLYHRFGGAAGWPLLGIAAVGFLFSLRLLLEHALDYRGAAPWSMQLSAHLQNWAIPLLAVLMLSAMVRSLPPAALVWAQPGSWLLAGLRYLYWRYVLRSALLIWILIGSGWAQRMADFWQLSLFAKH